MKKTQSIFSFVMVTILCCSTVLAETPYHQAATGFLAFRNSPKAIVAIDILHENSLNPELPAIPGGALVRLEGGGYILIAPSRRLTPVKAYSLTRPFEDLPPAVQRYLRQEMEGNARVARQWGENSDTRQSLTASETEARWDFLLTFEEGRHALAYTPDAWLLKTAWNQNHPYNKFTPRIDGAATYAGCTNTAIAQIMKYHRWPESGKGVAAYTWKDQTLKAILFKAYNWDQMPEKLDAATPAWQADQVAGLLSDVGIANQTNYGVDGSSAAVRINEMIQNFGYSTDLGSLSNANVDVFFGSLKGEIDAERPVPLSLPGHMVVADGYASDPTGRNIHLNMGWGGSHDDFYYLDSINQYIDAGGHRFSTSPGSLYIYFPVRPCAGPDCNWATGGGEDVPPVINTILADRILPQDQPSAERIYLDVRDENGDAVTVRVQSTHGAAVQAGLDGSILSLSTGDGGAASKITVTAEAMGKKTEKSFVVMTLAQPVGYGNAFEFTGYLTDQSAIYRHAAILDGACTITGDRGYSNQAFFTAVLSANDSPVIDWNDAAIQGTFERGRYTVAASLKNHTTQSYYSYQPGDHEGYVLKVSCPDAVATPETIAQILGIDLSGVDYRAGDVNDDGFVNLADAVLLLQVLAGRQPEGSSIATTAAIGVGKLGLPEVIYVLQHAAALR